MNADPALLKAALVGYEGKLARINEAIAGIQRALSEPIPGALPAAANQRRTRRRMSAAARARIAAAQKMRWAEYKKSRKK